MTKELRLTGWYYYPSTNTSKRYENGQVVEIKDNSYYNSNLKYHNADYLNKG